MQLHLSQHLGCANPRINFILISLTPSIVVIHLPKATELYYPLDKILWEEPSAVSQLLIFFSFWFTLLF